MHWQLDNAYSNTGNLPMCINEGCGHIIACLLSVACREVVSSGELITHQLDTNNLSLTFCITSNSKLPLAVLSVVLPLSANCNYML